MKDIYDYTSDKVSDVLGRVLKKHNMMKVKDDPIALKEINRLLDQDIALPIGYSEQSHYQELVMQFREKSALERPDPYLAPIIEPTMMTDE